MRYITSYILLFIPFFLFSQKSEFVKDLEKKRKIALSEIETTNQLLSQTKKTQSNVLQRLDLLSQQIKARKEVISLINKEITAIEHDIRLMEINLHEMEKELNIKKANYARSLQKMQLKTSCEDRLLFILSSKDFAQSYRRLRYLKQYAEWQKKQAVNISFKQKELIEEKEILAQSRNEKLILLKEREKETFKLTTEEDNQKIEIQNLKKKEKSLLAELQKKKKLAQKLNDQIENEISSEINQSNKEAKSSDSGIKKENRIAETKGGYAMTKEEQSLSTDFANNKGKLPFPLKGKYKIVGKFGLHRHQELKHVVIKNNGIDIQTTTDNDASSVFNGIVTKIFTLAGASNVIIIRHGNYLTVYSNISEVFVKKGDKVKTGQKIGKIFTDNDMGNTTILHFEIWKETIKLDPEEWLNI